MMRENLSINSNIFNPTPHKMDTTNCTDDWKTQTIDENNSTVGSYNNTELCDSSDYFQSDIFAFIQLAIQIERFTILPMGILLCILNVIVLNKFCGQLTNHLRFVLHQHVLDALFSLFYMLQGFCYKLISESDCEWFICGLLLKVAIMTWFIVMCNMTLMTLDHFIAIFKPLNYPMIITPRRVTIALCCMYIGPVVGQIGCSIFYVSTTKMDNSSLCEYLDNDINYLYYVNNYMYVVWLCLLMMMFVYSYILFMVYRRNNTYTLEHTQRTANAKAAVVTFLIIVSFLITTVLRWAFCLYVEYSESEFNEGINGILLNIFFLLAPLNPICDALLYALRLPKVKSGYRKMALSVRHKICQKNRNHVV